MPSYVPETIDGLNAKEQEIVLSLDPDLQPLALMHRAHVKAKGIPFNFISGLRSRGFQQMLFNRAQDDPRLIAAQPGNSKHEIGFAYDATGPRTDAEWEVYGREAEKLGLRWGGRFKDKRGNLLLSERPHVERPEPRSMLAIVRHVKLASVAVIFGGAIYASTRKGE